MTRPELFNTTTLVSKRVTLIMAYVELKRIFQLLQFNSLAIHN